MPDEPDRPYPPSLGDLRPGNQPPHAGDRRRMPAPAPPSGQRTGPPPLPPRLPEAGRQPDHSPPGPPPGVGVPPPADYRPGAEYPQGEAPQAHPGYPPPLAARRDRDAPGPEPRWDDPRAFAPHPPPPPTQYDTARPAPPGAHGGYRPPPLQQSYRPPGAPETAFAGARPAHWQTAGPDAPTPARSLWRKALYALLSLVAIVMLGVTYLLVSPPTGLVRDRLVAEIKARTGRELTISGKASMSFLPTFGVTLKDVTLSAPPGMAGPPLIRTESLEVRMALLPLITRDIEIDRLVLHRPVIELRVDANGRRSWDFADTTGLRAPERPQYAQANPRGPDGRPIPRELQDFLKNSQDKKTPRGKLSGVNGLSLSDVRITDGTLRYVDARRAVPIELNGVDGRLALKDLAGPLTLAASFALGVGRVSIDARLQSFKDLLDEVPSKIDVKLTAPGLNAGYDGQISGAGAPAFDGRVHFKTPSLDGLARLVQLPVAGLDAIGAIAVEGQLKTSPTTYALSQASLTVGETSAAGQIALDLSGPRPLIKPNLRFAALDLNQLAGAEPRLGAPPTAAPDVPPGGRFAAPVAGEAAPRSIEDLIDKPEDAAPAKPKPSGKVPAVRGFTRRSTEGWSSEAINPALLRVVDVDGRLDFGSIAWASMRLGATQSTVHLRAGVLKVDVPTLDLYGGKARALINVDAREPELTVGANISGDGLSTQPFLKDLANMDLLDGRGRLVVTVSAKGGSERELIGTLSGRAELKMTDGALLGWDAGQLVGNLAQGRIPKLDKVAGARTPFTELSGSFKIEHGVARNQDLKVDSPAVRASGSGVINIVDRNINMMVRPQAKATGGLAAVEVPVRIAGPFDKVSVVPDVGGALKSQPAQDALRQVGRQLKDGDVDGAARSLLGDDPKAQEKIDKAKQRLQRFLNR